MKKYKVLVEGFVLDDVVRAVGEIVELTEEAAKDAVADGAIELVVDYNE